MSKIVNCEFKKDGKTYYFDSNDFELNIGDNVIVNTEKGLQYATVVSVPKEVNEETLNNEFQVVESVATQEDYQRYLKNLTDAEKALKKAIEFSKELELDMKFTEASYSFDRSQIIFYYLSDNRVDFRELARKLAAVYKTRIELRQIGARDKAKKISGIGLCGKELCCASFLKNLDSVTITMAKNQSLALNPNKINGVCGRLLCCLNYEDSLYRENRIDMPETGEKYETEFGEGTVFMIDIPNRKFFVNVSNHGKVEVKLQPKCERCEKQNK